MPLRPAWSILLWSSLEKRMLAIFDREYAMPGQYPFSQWKSSKSMPKSFFLGKPKPLWAFELKLITLNSSAFFKRSHRRCVRQKWPRWLVPICISKPSAVVLLSGIIMTPALLIKISILSTVALVLLENSWIDFLSARSRGKKMTSAFLFLSYFIASSDLRASLAPKMMVHGCWESSFIVSLPMPVFAPVMTITLPERSLLALHFPPLAKNLIAVRERMVPPVIRAPQGESSQPFMLLTYCIIQFYPNSNRKQDLNDQQDIDDSNQIVFICLLLQLYLRIYC